MVEVLCVQCFSCNQYQVTQRRKDSKFSCKLCGSKQSVRKIYARSLRAVDVRRVVQELNLARGTAAEAYDEAADASFDDVNAQKGSEQHQDPLQRVSASQSHWKRFDITARRMQGEANQDNELDDANDEFVTAISDWQPRTRRTKRSGLSPGIAKRRRAGNANSDARAGTVAELRTTWDGDGIETENAQGNLPKNSDMQKIRAGGSRARNAFTATRDGRAYAANRPLRRYGPNAETNILKRRGESAGYMAKPRGTQARKEAFNDENDSEFTTSAGDVAFEETIM